MSFTAKFKRGRVVINGIGEHRKQQRAERQKEILPLYRKALTKISRMNLERLSVELSVVFGSEGFRFDCTVHQKGRGNTSFWFYDFWNQAVIERYLDRMIKVIKKDDFDQVLAVSDAISKESIAV